MRSCCTCHFLIVYRWFRYLSPDPMSPDPILFTFHFHIVLKSEAKVIFLFHPTLRCIGGLLIFFKEINHILIFNYPFLILCHTHKYYFTFDADTLLSQASIRIILGAFSIPKSFIVFKTVLRSPSVKYSITFKLWLVSLARSYTPT